MSTTWILVTVKGRPSMTERCLTALLNRTPRNERKLIVVDNGSTDATLDIVYRMFRRGDIHRLVCNKVFTVPQWQKSYAIHQAAHCLRMEAYDYFAWVDNDVVVESDWLQVARRVLDARPDIQVVSMHEDEEQTREHATLTEVSIRGALVRMKETANGALWVVRRDFFDRNGLPPVGQGIRGEAAEDWHYSGHFKERGVPFAVVPGYSTHLGKKDSAKREALKAGGK